MKILICVTFFSSMLYVVSFGQETKISSSTASMVKSTSTVTAKVKKHLPAKEMKYTKKTISGKDALTKRKSKSEKAATLEEYTPLPADIGMKVMCPVNGETFTIGPETPAVKYSGKTYFFCCAACLPEFKKHLDKYVK